MNNHLKYILITAIGVIFISLEALLIKLTSISSLTFSFYIGIFVFLSLNSVLFMKHKTKILHTYKENFNILLLIAFVFGNSNIFFILAINNTSVANVVLILATSPIFAAFLSYIFYKQKSEKNILISSFFIIIGLMIIFSVQEQKSDTLGNIYAIACTLTMSLAFVLLAQYKNINRYSVSAFSGIFTMLVSFVFLESLYIDSYTLFILCIMGLIVSPLARVLISTGTKVLLASEVSILMIIETIMAPIWVWLFLNEIPSSNTFIGGTLILITIIINSIYIIKKSKMTS
jgi:drug/metabolite transporter (DMT)-like permease